MVLLPRVFAEPGCLLYSFAVAPAVPVVIPFSLADLLCCPHCKSLIFLNAIKISIRDSVKVQTSSDKIRSLQSQSTDKGTICKNPFRSFIPVTHPQSQHLISWGYFSPQKDGLNVLHHPRSHVLEVACAPSRGYKPPHAPRPPTSISLIHSPFSLGAPR